MLFELSYHETFEQSAKITAIIGDTHGQNVQPKYKREYSRLPTTF